MSIIRRTSRASFVFFALVAAPSIFAGGGWYLLEPPRDKNDSLKILASKPLSQWLHHGAYDSALVCAENKNYLETFQRHMYDLSARRYRDAFSANEGRYALTVKESTMRRDQAAAESLETSRCISSDDPRLGK